MAKYEATADELKAQAREAADEVGKLSLIHISEPTRPY